MYSRVAASAGMRSDSMSLTWPPIMPSTVPVPARYFFNDLHARFRRTFETGHDFVSLCLKSVTGKDGDGLAENHMASRFATTEIVIIEGREIVMNERIGMQHFQSATQLFNALGKATGDHAGCFHA